jgi:ADP-heptose:LPS heptosyltransferase
VLSNDTMAVHLAVSCGRPTVIIANGVNYQRFTDYAGAGIAGVATVYPRVFLQRRARAPGLLYHYADALTSDIASIGAADVLQALERLLNPAGEALRD